MQYLEFYIVNYLLNNPIISHSTEKLAYLKHTIINNQDSYVISPDKLDACRNFFFAVETAKKRPLLLQFTTMQLTGMFVILL